MIPFIWFFGTTSSQLICSSLLLPFTSSIDDESPESTSTTLVNSAVTFVSTEGTPFGSGNTAYFDGTGYIEASYASENIIGEDDFTVECWVNAPGDSGYFAVWCGGPGYQNTIYIYDGYLTYFDNSFTEMGTQDTIDQNQWTHIAVTRQSGYLRLFINGYITDERMESDSLDITSAAHRIGNTFYSSPEYFVGYISNFRFIKGLALYTQEFTPANSPLDACVVPPPPPTPPTQALPIDLPSNLQCVPNTGSTNVVNDVAWYVFTLINTANIVFETTVTEGYTYDTEIGVYDNTGMLIGNDDDSGGNGLSLLTLQNLAPGTYYIAVGRYNVNFGAFFNANSDTPLIDDCTIQLNVYEEI